LFKAFDTTGVLIWAATTHTNVIEFIEWIDAVMKNGWFGMVLMLLSSEKPVEE